MKPLQSGQSCASFSRPCWFCRFFLSPAAPITTLLPVAMPQKLNLNARKKPAQALEARPENARTLKDYTALVIEYQRVYLITSHAADVPASLNQVAELFRTMGDLFDAKYYQRSIESFQFLMQQYPASKYREDALLAIAHIEQDDLHDSVLAQKTYEQFLTLHPRSSHAAEVRAFLDKLNAESATAKPAPPSSAVKDHSDRTTPKTISADKTPPTTDTKQGSSADNSDADGSGSQVSRIRTWNADTYTRIVIDVGSKVKYQAARISEPDRIYFDIEGAKVSSALLHKPIDIDSGGFLKTVRVAQNQSGVVRVVLEVNRVSDYSVFLLPDPYRLVVDVYGTSAAAEAAARNTAPPPGPTTTDAPPVKPEKPAKETVAKASPKPTEKAAAKSAPAPSANASAIPAQAQSAPAPPPIADAMAETEPAPRKTASNPDKNSQKTAVAASTKTMTGQDSETDGSTLSAAAAPADTEILPLPARPPSPKKSSRAHEIGPRSGGGNGAASHAGIDPRRATFPDARAGAQDRPDRDRCGAWRPRHRHDRAIRPYGKRLVPRCGPAAGQDHSTAVAERRGGVYARMMTPSFRSNAARKSPTRPRPTSLFRSTPIRARTVRRAESKRIT